MIFFNSVVICNPFLSPPFYPKPRKPRGPEKLFPFVRVLPDGDDAGFPEPRVLTTITILPSPFNFSFPHLTPTDLLLHFRTSKFLENSSCNGWTSTW